MFINVFKMENINYNLFVAFQQKEIHDLLYLLRFLIFFLFFFTLINFRFIFFNCILYTAKIKLKKKIALLTRE